MIALLLNSGRGTRMGNATKEHPKCMVPLDDTDTIISWQVELLRQYGVKDAVVTTGPFAELLKHHLEGLGSGICFHYIPNPRYAETNYIYSMHLAQEALRSDDVISLHGDLVLAPQVMEMLCTQPRSSVCVDSLLPLPEKDFKAETVQGRVRAIGIDRFSEDCMASQPAYKFLRADMNAWLDEIATFIANGKTGCYAENAFNAAWERIPLYALDVKGALCREIDTPEDMAEVTKAYRTMKKEMRK